MKKQKFKKAFLACGLLFLWMGCLFFSVTAFGQKELQSWNGINLKFPAGKKFHLNISQMASFTPAQGFEMNFAQSQVRLTADINKLISLSVGDQLNYIPTSAGALRNRLFLRGNINNKFSRFLKAEHAVQVEFHHKNESRYSRRLIFINELTTRNRFTGLNLRPSISYWLYYNQGGAPIQYYDKNGEPEALASPDGFHRGRLYASLNAKLASAVRLNLYYMRQREFNMSPSAIGNINVRNTVTGIIERPFNDFNALGLSLQFVMGND